MFGGLFKETRMTLSLKSATATIDPIHYPETDGKPMAESDLHRDLMFYIIRLLQRFFAGQKVYVSGNLLIYYEQGNMHKSVAPDCFVVRDIEPHPRAIYKVWEEGKGPAVVFEVSSKATHRDDLAKKMRLYAKLGVQEYFLYDPTNDFLDPALLAYELVGEGYIPMEPLNQTVTLGELAFVPGEGELPEFESKVLGLRVTLDEENHLLFYDLKSGERLLSDEEARHKVEAENAQLLAEIERLRRQLAEK